MKKSKMVQRTGLILIVIGTIIIAYDLFGRKVLSHSTKNIGYILQAIGLLTIVIIGKFERKDDKGGE